MKLKAPQQFNRTGRSVFTKPTQLSFRVSRPQNYKFANQHLRMATEIPASESHLRSANTPIERIPLHYDFDKNRVQTAILAMSKSEE